MTGDADKAKLRLRSYMTPGFSVPFFEHIAATLNCELDRDESRSGPAVDDDPFADGRADFGWVCSTSWFALNTAKPAPSVRLVGVAWVPVDPDIENEAVYFGDVVVPADSPIQTFDDLAGRRVGCNDEVSLSGHYALRFAARNRGHNPATFADLVFTSGHRRSLDLVVSGQLDAAVVDSVVRHSASRLSPDVARLRVVERLGPWPVQPLVARLGLADDVLATARAALLASNDDPTMQSLLRSSMLHRFVEVTAEHYTPIVRAMSSARHS